MSKRAYCHQCHYPAKVCVCDAIETQSSPYHIIILQHPNEAKHAKNTGRLVKLILPETTILTGESEQDFEELKQQVLLAPQGYHVFYPSNKSQGLESVEYSTLPAPEKTLIFIDATWRKALKMWHQNPWLQSCHQWHFSDTLIGHYAIRKTSVENGVSTLEAVAYALNQCCDHDEQPLLTLFDAMQCHHLSHHES